MAHSLELDTGREVEFSVFNGEDVDSLRKPYAIFSFGYRTRANLEALGFVLGAAATAKTAVQAAVAADLKRRLQDMSKDELVDELSQHIEVGSSLPYEAAQILLMLMIEGELSKEI